MMNLVDLNSRHILVIGASSGIGRQTAITLSKLGARLLLSARNEKKLEETLSLLEGYNNRIGVLDVADLDNLEKNLKQLIAIHGSLDGLVYCAGVGGSRPLSLLKPEKLDDFLKVNLYGFIESVRACTKKGRYKDGMRIVAISSVASMAGDKGHTAYSAAKAGMDGAVRCMAKELAEKRIAINTVAPGMTDTGMYSSYLNKNGVDSNNSLLQRQYMGIGQPQDVANAVAFLISPAARFITGTCIPVDGGYTSC